MAQDSPADPLPTSTAPVPTYQIILSPEAYRGLRVLGRSAYPLGGPSAGELRVLVLDKLMPCHYPHDAGSRMSPMTIEDEGVVVADVPQCCYASHKAPMAEQLYAAYNLSGPVERAGITWDDKLVPTWEQLKERAKSGDKSAAAVIAKWEGVAHRAALLNPDILSVL